MVRAPHRRLAQPKPTIYKIYISVPDLGKTRFCTVWTSTVYFIFFRIADYFLLGHCPLVCCRRFSAFYLLSNVYTVFFLSILHKKCIWKNGSKVNIFKIYIVFLQNKWNLQGAATKLQLYHSVKIHVHRKKRFTSFPSPAGMSLTKLPLGRNNSVMTSLFPPRESLVATSRLGTGNSQTFFYGV